MSPRQNAMLREIQRETKEKSWHLKGLCSSQEGNECRNNGWRCISFLWLLWQMAPKRVAYHHRNLLSPGSEGQGSSTSRDARGGPFPSSQHLGSWGRRCLPQRLLAPSHPWDHWFVAASLQSPPPSAQGVFSASQYVRPSSFQDTKSLNLGPALI